MRGLVTAGGGSIAYVDRRALNLAILNDLYSLSTIHYYTDAIFYLDMIAIAIVIENEMKMRAYK